MWSFQITYITPIRRARASVLPALSVASSAAIRRCTRVRSAARRTSTAQSNARPSWCSERLPPQAREMVPNRPPYRATIQRPSRTVPGLALGEQAVAGWYDA